MTTGSPERLAIAGSGAIACGLAVVAAGHGEVVLWARSSASGRRARELIDSGLRKLDRAGDATRVAIVSELDGLAGASFAVEAIAELEAPKRELLERLGSRLAPDALLATTTSSLSIAELARASGRPDRFVGLHVFNPVTRMELVELAFPEAATEETRSRAHALCARFGKTAVEVPDIAGFVVNRLLFPYLFDAVRLYEATGMPAGDLDSCLKLGAGHPMGPLALLDFVGLDVSIAIGEALGAEIPALLRELVASGALGRKSGRGIHEYADR